MKLLSIKQAADKLGKSRQYVWLLIKMGKLKARKVGSRYIVTQVQLDKYISVAEFEKKNSEINKLSNKLNESQLND